MTWLSGWLETPLRRVLGSSEGLLESLSEGVLSVGDKKEPSCMDFPLEESVK